MLRALPLDLFEYTAVVLHCIWLAVAAGGSLPGWLVRRRGGACDDVHGSARLHIDRTLDRDRSASRTPHCGPCFAGMHHSLGQHLHRRCALSSAACVEQDVRLPQGSLAPAGHIATRRSDGRLISSQDISFWHERLVQIPKLTSDGMDSWILILSGS